MREGTVWPGKGATVEVSRGVGVVSSVSPMEEARLTVTLFWGGAGATVLGRRLVNCKTKEKVSS